MTVLNNGVTGHRGNPEAAPENTLAGFASAIALGVDFLETDVHESADGVLKPILENPVLFGVNLYEAGLAGKVEGLFAEMLAGPGAVRATLKKYL